MTINEAKYIVKQAGLKITEAGNREQRQKIQQHIRDHFDYYDDMISELEHAWTDGGRDGTGGQPGLRYLVQNGTFLVYYDDQRKFLTDLYHTPLEDQDKYSDDVVFKRYVGLLAMEMSNILDYPEGGGLNYLDPNA